LVISTAFSCKKFLNLVHIPILFSAL
jgi:hypothetical protein